MGAPLSPSEVARRAEIAARAANGALHQDEPYPMPMRAAVADPERKPWEPRLAGDDQAGSSSETNARQCHPAAGERSGARGEEDGQRRASAAGAGGSPALLPSRIEPEISPVDVWVMTETGLRRWRPIIDQLTVTPLPNGERILDIGGHRLRLNEALAAHVARLLSPSVDQEGR